MGRMRYRPVPPTAKHGQVAEQPGDVVDQDAPPAEQDRGPQHGMRDAQVAQGLLDRGLAAEVRVAAGVAGERADPAARRHQLPGYGRA
jgi:hypothetical protein